MSNPLVTRKKNCPKCNSIDIRYLKEYYSPKLILRKETSTKDGIIYGEKSYLYRCEECNIEFILIKR